MGGRAARVGHGLASRVIWLLLGAALAGEVWHATPTRHSEPVLVVTTPGFALGDYLPLAQGLADARRDVHVLVFGCGDEDVEALSAEVRAALQRLGPRTVVVAHGFGAVPALHAAATDEAHRLVLLAPVLDLWPVAATTWAAEQPGLDWSAPIPWRGHADVREVLLGRVPELGCVPAGVAEEVRAWVRQASVPLPLEQVDEPVAIAVSTGDAVAAVEAVVEASRRLPRRELTRLGLERFDRQDFGHTGMLMDPVPVEWAVKAVTARRSAGSP